MTLKDDRDLHLSERDWKKFVESVDNPGPTPPKLIEAAERYKAFMGEEITLEEAIKTDRQLILTLDPPDGSPPFTVVMTQPYCISHDFLYGCLEGDIDVRYGLEFISKVELGGPIIEK